MNKKHLLKFEVDKNDVHKPSKDKNPKAGVYMIGGNGEIFGNVDYSKIKDLNFFKRLLCKVSKRYKDKHKSILPMETHQDYINNYKNKQT